MRNPKISKRPLARKMLALLLVISIVCGAVFNIAFAGSVPATIVVAGLTLKTEPTKTTYSEGEKFTFDGFELEVTYVTAADIKEKGDDAKRYSDILENADGFVKYGITCNYEEGQIMEFADAFTPLTFNFGPKGACEFVTDCYFAVCSDIEEYAAFVEYFDLVDSAVSGSDFLVVADGQMITDLVYAGKPGVGGLKPNDVLATVKADIGTGKVITDILANADTDVELNNLFWHISYVRDTVDGCYELPLFDGDSRGYLNTIVNENGAYNNNWPLITKSGRHDWTVDNGVMYTTVTKTELKEVVTASDVSGADFKIEFVPVEVSVKVYLAVDKGYAYLTADRAKAADVDLYKVCRESMVDDIEIVKDADRMTYFEGETFDPSGMAVNLLYNDKIVACIPEKYFDTYGISAAYPDGALSVKDNGAAITVDYKDFTDECDTKLTVKALGSFDAVIPTGKLADGNYVIGWFDDVERGPMTPGEIYGGMALDADMFSCPCASILELPQSTASASPVQAKDNELGVFSANAFPYTPALDGSMIWNVRYTGTDGYTIRQASTGMYLTQTEEVYPGSRRGLVLADTISENAYWDIDGTFNAAIRSAADGDADQYIVNAGKFFLSTGENALPDAGEDNFYFFKTAEVTVSSIEIVELPEVDGLKDGDKLDLHAMVVAVTYTDGSVVNVPYDDFVSYGITSSMADGEAVSAGEYTLTVALGTLTDSFEFAVAGDDDGGDDTEDKPDDGLQYIVDDKIGVVLDADPAEGTVFRYSVDDTSDISKVYLVITNTASADRKDVVSAVEAADRSFTADSKNHIMFDASHEDEDGNKLILEDGSISIGIKYPESVAQKYKDYNFALYHISGGKAEKVTIETKSDGIWFSADDFSPFMLTYVSRTSAGNNGSEENTSGSPDTGDRSGDDLVNVCVAVNLVLISAAAIYFVTQKQQERAVAAAFASYFASREKISAAVEASVSEEISGADSDSDFDDFSEFEYADEFDGLDESEL